jgi:acyl dehydratase
MALRDIDPAVIGRDYDEMTYPPVTAAELVSYAKSLGVEDPLYVDEVAAGKGPYGGLVAFPTFVVKLRGGVHFPPAVAKEMTRAGFDAGKDIELGVPIRPGDVLTARSRVTEIYDKTGRSGTMTFLVFRHELRNQRDELVANVDNRIMQRQL